jgi:hypothetical protein
MAGVTRNAPCPCGSGRRYKDCHGALETERRADSTSEAKLRAALDSQREGRFEDARRLYGQVLAVAPNHFDAVHMLGVVNFQLGLLQEARSHLLRATMLRPHSPEARSNLDLVMTALEHASIEREICHEVLPRLLPLCAPPDEFYAWLRSTTAVHFVASFLSAAAAIELFDGLGSRCSPVPVRRWRGHGRALALLDWEPIEARCQQLPRNDLLVACPGPGTMAHWLVRACPERAALLITDDEPGYIIDALRELTRQGRRRVPVLYATDRVARTIGLPGTVLPQVAVGAAP